MVRQTTDEGYGFNYKIASATFFCIASIGMEELNQLLYRSGFKYIFFMIALQQFFALITFPVFAYFGNKVTNKYTGPILKKFVVPKQLKIKNVIALSISAFVWSLNVALARLVSMTFGSGPLDVMKSLIVPFSSTFMFIYFGKKQTKLCVVGIAVLASAFIMNLPNLVVTTVTIVDGDEVIRETFSYARLLMGVMVGVIAAHQTLISQNFLKYCDGNGMQMMFLQTPWAILYFLFFSYMTGEFDGFDRTLRVARPSISSLTGEECFGLMERLRAEDSSLYFKIFIVASMGIVINIATMNMLQALSVVSNNVVSQMKSTLGSAVGFTVNYFATGKIPTTSQIAAAAIKSVGGGVYTAGKLKGINNKPKEQHIAVLEQSSEPKSRRASTDSFNRSMADACHGGGDLMVDSDEESD